MASKWNVGDCLPDLTHDERRWEIKKVLGGTGKSGMGVVYVVYDRAWKKTFAAKTFQDEAFARSPQVAKRFIQEAHTWINLGSHPNVTQAHFIYRIPSQPPHFTGNYAWLERVEARPFLFLEYVRGDDLAAWIGTARLTGNLSQVLHFTIQFCDGMIHALSKGIKAHRDIKPQNCLISDDGTLKVTDFGLAKVVDDAMNELDDSPEIYEWLGDSPQFVSHTGKRGGTPAYMAPEQFTDTKRVDVRADVYSFGVMLYEMVTGRLPFQGRTWNGRRPVTIS